LIHFNAVHKSNQLEVLRLLLAVLSKPMFVPIDFVLEEKMEFLNFLAQYPSTNTERKKFLAFLCTLVNSGLSFDIGGGWLPYLFNSS
jgi:hypothetical protein